MCEVDNYGEALELVEQGFGILMSDGRSKPTLAFPNELNLSDDPYDQLDDLWKCDVPAPPFPKAALDGDIRCLLLRYFGTVSTFVGQGAARECFGLIADFEASASEKIDIRSFNLTHLVHAAYDSAFRTGSDRVLSDYEFEQLEDIIVLMLECARNPRGVRGSGEMPTLHRTVMCAWLRWKISRGELMDCDWGGTTTGNLALLAGMAREAVRNGLAKDGISTLKDKICGESIVGWLEGRRNFVPLREVENPRMLATSIALAKLYSMPLVKALSNISKTNLNYAVNQTQVRRLEVDIIAAVAEQGAAPSALLRCYARSLRLRIDSFVLGFSESCLRKN